MNTSFLIGNYTILFQDASSAGRIYILFLRMPGLCSTATSHSGIQETKKYRCEGHCTLLEGGESRSKAHAAAQWVGSLVTLLATSDLIHSIVFQSFNFYCHRSCHWWIAVKSCSATSSLVLSASPASRQDKIFRILTSSSYPEHF